LEGSLQRKYVPWRRNVYCKLILTLSHETELHVSHFLICVEFLGFYVPTYPGLRSYLFIFKIKTHTFFHNIWTIEFGCSLHPLK
jgi:hypothetical protein